MSEATKIHTADSLQYLFSKAETPERWASAIAAFSYTLAHVVGADEAELVDGLESMEVVSQAVEAARARR